MQSEQINELAAALAKAQGAMQNAVMNRTNPHFKSKYADLSSVLDAIRAPLSANGLAIVQTMTPAERFITLRTTLMHSSGQFIATEYPIPMGLKPHEMGSALTYGRRYSVAALICNSADEDDDGNEAMKGKPVAVAVTNGNGTRQNPHVTRPEDIYEPSNDPDDKVQSDPAPTKMLTVAEQRPIFEALQREIHATVNVAQLMEWRANPSVKARAALIKADWRQILDGVYKEHKDALIDQDRGDELRARTPNTLMAG